MKAEAHKFNSSCIITLLLKKIDVFDSCTQT